MRPNSSSKRQRSRNRSKSSNPLARSYESNGPDVKIRGSALQVADKYSQLARDAQSSGDRVMAENYFQHAEHYYRIVAQAYEQSGQTMRDRRDDRDEFGRDDPQPDIPNRDNDERDREDTREAQTTSTKEVNGHENVGEEDGLRRTLRANGSKNGAHTADAGEADASDDASEGEQPVAVAPEAVTASEDEPEPKPKRRARSTRTRRPRRTESEAPAESPEPAS